MSQQPTHRNFSRRKALAGIGAGGVLLAQYARTALAQDAATQPTAGATENMSSERVASYATVNAFRSQATFQEGELVQTTGFHTPGDGGGALYGIAKQSQDTQPNDANIIALENGLAAVLLENETVNYRMFGAVSDGVHDDGVQIKLAHLYAREHQIPIVNLSGEFWIKQTNDIPITTNVHWGKTTFHIDERYNDKRTPRFVVHNDQPTQTVTMDDATKAAVLDKLKPGVQLISELAPYAGHLITVVDSKDRIGVRAGTGYSKRGWAREELFYVEEEGRIVGDIAWQFKNFTSVTATPCNDNYLVIEGGGLYFSGDTPVNSSPGYHQHGILVQRSRTIIRQQWMGLEPGKQDMSLEPRTGFYVFKGVYDVTLENIRAMPWEKNRRDKAKAVKHGTYGIGGARMLNCTFRNLTAEAGWVSWGVFGTNLNKNFRVENCRLNRIDVHFHCWNLYISNCTIGFKGITVTGGGDLFIDNTTRHGSSFVGFRRDYGAKWDGHVRLRGCTLKPSSSSTVSVLDYHPNDFDYQYPIGFARSIQIEDLVIDYSAVPDSKSACWMMNIVPFSKTRDNSRLFFPSRIEFRNIAVVGRTKGVRLLHIANPYHYTLDSEGAYDGSQLTPNCTLVCDNVQLEQLTLSGPDDSRTTHLAIGGTTAGDYADQLALHPKIRFSDCDNVSVYLGNCIASATFERCTVNTIAAPALRGALTFTDCHLQPVVKQAAAPYYVVDSSLGTRFTNCTLHAPIVNGNAEPEQVNQLGFLEINRSLQHYHMNTVLANGVLKHLQSKKVVLSTEFIAKLMAHYGLVMPTNS